MGGGRAEGVGQPHKAAPEQFGIRDSGVGIPDSPVMSPLFLTLMIVMGAVAGALGALLGLGGGVFLVPFLVLAVGLPIKTAVGISLITVIATSSTVSGHSAGRQLINLRLGMVLEVATAAGGLMGGITAYYFSETTIEILFAVVAIGVAGVMLTRLDRRNVITEPDADQGLLGGRDWLFTGLTATVLLVLAGSLLVASR